MSEEDNNIEEKADAIVREARTSGLSESSAHKESALWSIEGINANIKELRSLIPRLTPQQAKEAHKLIDVFIGELEAVQTKLQEKEKEKKRNE